MKKFFYALTVLLFTATPCFSDSKAVGEAITIPAEEAKKMLDDGANIKIIDVRQKTEFSKSHINGAVNATAEEVDAKFLAKTASDKNSKLLFYGADGSDSSAGNAAGKAMEAGYTYVYIISGGYETWKDRGYETGK